MADKKPAKDTTKAKKTRTVLTPEQRIAKLQDEIAKEQAKLAEKESAKSEAAVAVVTEGDALGNLVVDLADNGGDLAEYDRRVVSFRRAFKAALAAGVFDEEVEAS